jgi:hypothetical protein
MASAKAISAALLAFAEDRGGAVTQERAQLWFDCLNDVADPHLMRAVNILLRTNGTWTIPTIAMVRDAAGANPPPDALPAIDTEALLKRIGALGSYDPRTGWCWPTVERVWAEIGPSEATAYGLVGPSRLFSDQSTTREIAQREFSVELRREQREAQERARLAPPEEQGRLSAGG